MKKYSSKNHKSHSYSSRVGIAKVTEFSKKAALASTLIFFLLSCTKNADLFKPLKTESLSQLAPRLIKPGYNINEASLKNKGWSKTFEDDFAESLPDTLLNTDKWTYWTGGAYNNELQYYQLANLEIINGDLQIKAKEEQASGYNYTSGRIESIDTFRGSDHSKIRIYARIKLPADYGLWPALWTLGVDGPGESWPQNGEMDIMESKVNVIGKTPTKYQTNFFYGTNNLVPDNPDAAVQIPNVDLINSYHVFMVEWTHSQLKFYYDDILKVTYTGGQIPNLWDKSQRIILNLAYGGKFFDSSFVPGHITDGIMHVDWVKVFVK